MTAVRQARPKLDEWRERVVTRLQRRPEPFEVVNTIVLLAIVAFVFWQLQPSQLFRNTLPAGGDMGAHVWQPAYLRDHLLPHWRLTGWTPDWYAGFPTLVFYFPLPSLMIVGLSVILPYGVAFKLVTVAGLLTLPLAAFAFGKLMDLRDPGPACLAVGTLPFLFDRSFTIYGGNIPSTLAGEFAFSISLSLALLFLGVFARGLRNGRHRALAAVLLAVTCLCHVVPTFFAIGGALVLLLFQLDRNRLKWAVPTLVTGGLLAAFWVLPFMMRLAYTNDMGWEKITTFQKTLFPHNLTWVVVLAATGAVASIVQRHRAGAFLTVMTVLSGLAFVWAPQGRLWNARLLPFWFLCLWLLAGLAIAEIGQFAASAIGGVVDARREDDDEPVGAHFAAGANGNGHGPVAAPVEREQSLAERVVLLATPLVAVLGALVLVGFPLRVLPGGEVTATGSYRWMGIESLDRSFVPDWVRWNYSGYQSPLKSRHDEYFNLVATMGKVGKTEGCGRAMWEYEAELDGMGTPMAPMLLPYWTDGCIGSMEGLFFESSATTPFHFLNQSELSARPSRAQRDLPYSNTSVQAGIQHLQLLGVRYYMALSPEVIQVADTLPDLRLVATSGPWTVHYSTGDQQRTWHIYEVAQSAEVAPLQFQPAVMKGVAKGGKPWLKAAVAWYTDPSRWDVPLAVSGPKEWERVDGAAVDPPRDPVAPVRVSNIVQKDDRISFDVDRVGQPVLVKMSYFPNWHASGAKGPWRVTPNQMVVIPTSKHVSLHYGYTPVDAFAYLLTLTGIAGVVVLWQVGPVVYPPKRRRGRGRSPEPPAPTGDPQTGMTTYYDDLGRELAGVGARGGDGLDTASYFDDDGVAAPDGTSAARPG